MRRFVVALALLASSVAQATQWYASNRTSLGGSGTLADPWDLHTALGQPPAVVAPGDTINLRGGTYTSIGDCNSSTLDVGLQGTARARITVKSGAGEWAKIDIKCWGLYGGIHLWKKPRIPAYIDFRDFEMYNGGGSRKAIDQHLIYVEGVDFSSGAYGARTSLAHHIRIINCVLHDNVSGSGIVSHSGIEEIVGNVIYYNGGPLDSNKYHNGYLRPDELGVHTMIKDNIQFDATANNWSNNSEWDNPTNPIHPSPHYVGNILIRAGQLRLPAPVQSLNVATNGDGLFMTSNMIYPVGGPSGGGMKLGYDDHGCNNNAVLTNNFFVGRVRFHNCLQGITLTGNSFYANSPKKWFSATSNDSPEVSLVAADYPGNTFTTSTPGSPWILVRANPYESGRGHIGILNWTGAGSVSVDVSSILTTGHNWSLYWAGTFTGKLNSTPVQTGTNFGGSTISVTMTAYPMATPLLAANPGSFGPLVGAFILFDEGGGATPTPNANLHGDDCVREAQHTLKTAPVGLPH
jgi:hypothetical protein